MQRASCRQTLRTYSKDGRESTKRKNWKENWERTSRRFVWIWRNMNSENNIITSLAHRRSLHFVAINFSFMAIIVNAIKCLDHSPITRTFFISCIVSLRPAFPKSLNTSTSSSLFSVASLSLNFLVPSPLILLQNLITFLVSNYFLFGSDFQVFWSISSIVKLWLFFSQIFSIFLRSNITYLWQASMPILWVPIFSFQPSSSSCTLNHNVLFMKFHDLVTHALKIVLLGLSVALFSSFLSYLQPFLPLSLLTFFQFPHSPVL